MKPRYLALFLLIATAFAQAPQLFLNASFNGDWVGTLEYRDFQSNQQVFLPTWLTLSPSPDGNSIRLNYIYDDGPSKTLHETATLTFVPTPAPARAILTNEKDHTSENFSVEGLAEFSKLGRGNLILTGPGTENGHPVDVRMTLTLRRNLYSLRKETRLPGEDFKFRDAYTFTRAKPPTP